MTSEFISFVVSVITLKFVNPQALVEIQETISEENVEGCLPLWARNYHKISIVSTFLVLLF